MTTAELRQSILRNKLRPGVPVTEDAMAAEIGVSRSTMRQALNTLLLEGLLTRHPTTRVLAVTTLSQDDVRDIYRARRFLELGGVDAAAGAAPEALDPLRAAAHDLKVAVGAGDVRGFVDADFRCHAETVAFLGSRHLTETHRLLMSKLRLVFTQFSDDERDKSRSLVLHEEFTDLMVRGRIAEARANLASRLDNAERLILGKTPDETSPPTQHF
ncbi:MAG: GntR family transcriptional regulator [Actinomycetota bacterium]